MPSRNSIVNHFFIHFLSQKPSYTSNDIWESNCKRNSLLNLECMWNSWNYSTREECFGWRSRTRGISTLRVNRRDSDVAATGVCDYGIASSSNAIHLFIHQHIRWFVAVVGPLNSLIHLFGIQLYLMFSTLYIFLKEFVNEWVCKISHETDKCCCLYYGPSSVGHVFFLFF